MWVKLLEFQRLTIKWQVPTEIFWPPLATIFFSPWLTVCFVPVNRDNCISTLTWLSKFINHTCNRKVVSLNWCVCVCVCVYIYTSIMTCMSDYRWGLNWWMGLLTTYTHDTTSNYSATANLHNCQITQNPLSLFPALLCLHLPFPCNSL
jgi:hypothetical protein